MGSPNELGWLSKVDVTFAMASHRKSLRDPASAKASRFFLAIRSEKVRLRSG